MAIVGTVGDTLLWDNGGIQVIERCWVRRMGFGGWVLIRNSPFVVLGVGKEHSRKEHSRRERSDGD